MSQLEIADVVRQIEEEIEIDAQGRGKGSIRAVARLAGVDDESIRKSLVSAADQKPSKLAQTLMSHGFDGADLEKWRSDGIRGFLISCISEVCTD